MLPMIVATLAQVLAGLLAPLLLAILIRRRWGISWALILPGAIAGLIMELLAAPLQSSVIFALAAVPDAFTLPVFAGVSGFASGLAAALLLTAAFAWLARNARTTPQVLMIGVGYGGAGIAMRAALAALVLAANLQLAGTPPEDWRLSPAETAARQAALDIYFATPPDQPLLEAVGALGRILHGLAAAALVGGMFLSGQVGWFFGGLLWVAVAVSGAALFGPLGAAAGAVWWALLGAGGAVIVWRCRR
ncbi:MAG: hypothetical protein HPY64_01690 [Anaerolineae bacterium]|nr:hypothetical protein [Anaerolineae bacterium]